MRRGRKSHRPPVIPVMRIVQRRSMVRLIRANLPTTAVIAAAAVVAVDSVCGIWMMVVAQRPPTGAKLAHVHGSRGGRRGGEIVSLARSLVAGKIGGGKGSLGPRLLNQMAALLGNLVRSWPDASGL